jgi:SH3-like domain-containing protein
MKTPIPRLLLLAGFLAASAYAAFEAGSFAYTKKLETTLLAEPKPLAEPAGKIAQGHKVKVEEVKGAWLRVSEGPVAGWVYAGNLAATKPDESNKFDGVALLASKTTATAAARPLDDAVVEYATQRNLGDARGDLEWMMASCAEITEETVDQFLQEQKKGEYQ